MILITCPHCQQLIEMLALNCSIFRCGQYRRNGEQIPPHLHKEECDRLAMNMEIWGCGKPFRVEVIPSGYQAIVCDYI
jgi:hypothetical protein